MIIYEQNKSQLTILIHKFNKIHIRNMSEAVIINFVDALRQYYWIVNNNSETEMNKKKNETL